MPARRLALALAFASALLLAGCSTPQPAPTLTPPPATASPAPPTATPRPTPPPTPSPTAVPLHLGWTWGEAGTRMTGQVTGADGIVYTASLTGTVYAVAAPGNVLWTYHGQYQYGEEDLPFLSPALVLSRDGDTVYYTTADDWLVALDAGDGSVRWTYDSPDGFWGDPALAPDGSIYMYTLEHGGVRIFPDGTAARFAFADETFVPSFDAEGNLYMLSRDRLTIASPEGTPLIACAAAEDAGGEVLTGPGGSALYMSGDGLVAQRPDCSFAWKTDLVDRKSGESPGPYCPFILDGDGLYVACTEGRLVALNAVTGQVLWKSERNPALGDLREVVAGGDGIVFAASSRGLLLAFDARGQLTWSQAMYEPGRAYTLQLTQTDDLVMVQAGRVQVYTRNPALAVALPVPANPPASRADAEAEIAAYLRSQTARGTALSSGQLADPPWSDAPRGSGLIVYCMVDPAQVDVDGNPLYWGKTRQAWWYAPGQLTEITKDMEIVVAEYRYHQEPAGGNLWTFGILSVSDDFLTAEAYIEHRCGFQCADGTHNLLIRSPSGRWWVYGAVSSWMT